MIRTALSPRSVWLLVRISLAALSLILVPRGVHAQFCGSPATGVLAESGVCGPFVRLSWTNPPGFIFPKVWRSADQNFANATLIYNPGLGGATSLLDAPPTGGVNYYYWVGGDITNCPGSTGLRQVPLTGPLPAGRFTPTFYPAAVVESTCTGIRITWQPAWDNTSWRLVRVDTNNSARLVDLGTIPRTTTTYFDTDVTPGNRCIYALQINSSCSTTSGAVGTQPVRAGPWSSAAARSASVNVGQSATLSVVNPSASGEAITSPSPTNLVWTRNNLPLADGTKYSGTTTQTLTINNARLEDAGVYTLAGQNACGSFFFDAVLGVTQRCRADFNQSGAVSVQDIFDYLSAYFAGCP